MRKMASRLPKPAAGRPERPVLEQGVERAAAQPTAPLAGKVVVLGVTASIAAYKAAMLLRLLRKAGATVHVILSESAKRFVGESTFRGLGAEVHTDMWSAPGELHVELGARADAVLVAPATADVLSRLAQGRADDLLTATVLCRRGPLVLAPAMHPRMWHDAAVAHNVTVLAERGATFIGPVEGEVASGDVGLGRLAEPEHIARDLAELIAPGTMAVTSALAGRHVVVSAGPTAEPLDPVRSLTNVSSGKMGFAIAAALRARGARVTLVAGPVTQPTPQGVARVDVGSALEMRQALWTALGADLEDADALVMAAAVADYRPKARSSAKLKRSSDDLTLELVPNPDLLAEIGHARKAKSPVLVGFALETAEDEELVQHARKKLVSKRIDLVVANRAEESLGRDDNRVFLVSAVDCKPIPRDTKAALAEHIVDFVAGRLQDVALSEESSS
jgi:phosphopantothenoylcysteine decarboxylase/phosphopantothenate--cysteine ligase